MHYSRLFQNGCWRTLIGASLSNRNALGIDLSSKYINAYKKASRELGLKFQTTIKGDCITVLKEKNVLKSF